MKFFKENIDPKIEKKDNVVDPNRFPTLKDSTYPKETNKELKIPTTFPDILKETKIEVRYLDHLPKSNGIWTGERGNSDWIPNADYIPPGKNAGDGGTNPDKKNWGQIFKKYKIEKITFKDGDPDFSPVSKGEVKIDDFSTDRDYNFSQADEKLAKEKGYSPEEVEKWRKENKYTWHELRDCKTMQKVPREVHNHVEHSGGISELKNKENNEVKGE